MQQLTQLIDWFKVQRSALVLRVCVCVCVLYIPKGSAEPYTDTH